jgi:hypothetical protein
MQNQKWCCEGDVLTIFVIPVKTGISNILDSRFRGNDKNGTGMTEVCLSSLPNLLKK